MDKRKFVIISSGRPEASTLFKYLFKCFVYYFAYFFHFVLGLPSQFPVIDIAIMLMSMEKFP